MVYFDHNATSPLLPVARQAWIEANETFIGNPSSPHRIGARAEAALAQGRQRLAALIGCDPLDLVWTSGATESNNMVLHHAAKSLAADAKVWISAIEHPCVLQAAQIYFPKRIQFIPADRPGVVDLNWLEKQLRKKRPGLVGIMAANNETGVLQPWREALALCQAFEVPFFCDAVQWIGKLRAKGLGACDFVSGCAHKFGGPRGVGFLKCPAKGPIYPLLAGGPQEEGRRAGTENLSGVLAMVRAIEEREASLTSEGLKRRLNWRQAFEQTLARVVPGAEIVGATRERLWNTVSAVMPVTESQQRWVVKLDKLGFAVSTGSACSSGREKPSHVLASMGFSSEEAGRALRFSSSWETQPEQWADLGRALQKVYRARGAASFEPRGAIESSTLDEA